MSVSRTATEPAPRKAASKPRNPRILVVTPEITYLPSGMGNLAQRMRAKAGGLADVSASLVNALYEQEADVHVALPNYRRMFHLDVQDLFTRSLERVRGVLPEKRIHLAEDRVFYYRSNVYSATENHLISLAFQREIINHIIPEVSPDLIHCNDWMTGLIPAVARRHGIHCLFTVHNIHTERLTLEQIEDRGVDAAEFWRHLYFDRRPESYEETRWSNSCDLLASGIFASAHVNSVSPTFLHEVVEGRHPFVPPAIRGELANKLNAGCADGILNAPDASYDPAADEHLVQNYGPANHVEAKRVNKVAFQERTGLKINPDAPLFFWPSRLDPIQKGCSLLTDILYETTHRYYGEGIQIGVVANGAYQGVFRDIVARHDLEDQVAVADFDEGLSRLGYAASDFMIMPSLFEPCGLPQMVSTKYGSLPIVHNTGGLHDTIEPLDPWNNRGNGFRFDHYDAGGLRWAISEAMEFYRRPADEKGPQVARVMEDAMARFNHATTAAAYIERYEAIMQRPLTN